MNTANIFPIALRLYTWHIQGFPVTYLWTDIAPLDPWHGFKRNRAVESSNCHRNHSIVFPTPHWPLYRADDGSTMQALPPILSPASWLSIPELCFGAFIASWGLYLPIITLEKGYKNFRISNVPTGKFDILMAPCKKTNVFTVTKLTTWKNTKSDLPTGTLFIETCLKLSLI